jgi:hypothetical protein
MRRQISFVLAFFLFGAEQIAKGPDGTVVYR